MKLAVVAGTVHVDEMLSTLTPKQFKEWVAFYSIELGAVADDKPESSLDSSMNAARRMAGV